MTQQRWRLDGQTALITGASAGIGLAIAHELAGFGADLMIVGRDIDMLETARDELLDVYPQMQVHALAADVSDDEPPADPGLGGRPQRWPAHPGQQRRWQRHQGGHGIPRTNGARSSRPTCSRPSSCRATRTRCWPGTSSSIVNVGVSGLTHVRSGVVYGMSKAAMHQMTRNLAVEWAEDGIRVNAVAPWYIRTRRTSGPLSDPDYYEEVINRTPMRRIGEEVAAAVGFLCLPAASCHRRVHRSGWRLPALRVLIFRWSCRPLAGNCNHLKILRLPASGGRDQMVVTPAPGSCWPPARPAVVRARRAPFAVFRRGEPLTPIAEALLPTAAALRFRQRLARSRTTSQPAALTGVAPPRPCTDQFAASGGGFVLVQVAAALAVGALEDRAAAASAAHGCLARHRPGAAALHCRVSDRRLRVRPCRLP